MTSASSTGVSLRAVLLGLFFCLAIALGEPYGVLVLRGSPLGVDFTTGAALFLFFLLSLLFNPLARALTGSGLHRGELVTIYIMMVVATAIPSWGFTLNLIPLMSGFFYYATPENGWIEQILPNLAGWLVPDHPDAAWKLFEGSPPDEPVPWAAWARPLLFWSLFIVTIYFVTICLLVMLRKQWMEREKLLFPLAVLPLEMSRQERGSLLSPFFKSKLMWFGFLIPATINTINGLHSYYDFLLAINLNMPVSILRESITLNCRPRFEVIGLSYLLSLDVSFGVWFFAFLALLQTGVQRMLGWSIGPVQPFSDPASPSVAHLALGALFVLVLTSFWNSRQHFMDIVKKSLYGDPTIDDSDEIMPYRTAFWGAILGLLLAAYWLLATGLNLLSTAVFLLSSLVIFVGLARIISQTGLAYCRATVCAPVFTVNALGTSQVGTVGLTSLGLGFAWAADVRILVMASVAIGLKMAAQTRLEPRRLFWAIVLAIVATLIGSAWAIIELAYTYGGINLTGWQFSGLPNFAGNWIIYNMNNPQPPHLWHLGFTGGGALLMGLLTWVKGRFVGFPIHPIGMTLGLTHPIYHAWFSVFVAWLIKAFILKYGGARLYLLLRPFFLGIVLGGFASAGIWLVIDHFTGMTGNVFTL